jgi:hypothetical protein
MQYEVIGPDDYPISPELFDTEEEANAAIKAFAERFSQQGYYSGVNGRIPLDCIADCCLVMQVEVDEEWEDDGESFPE